MADRQTLARRALAAEAAYVQARMHYGRDWGSRWAEKPGESVAVRKAGEARRKALDAYGDALTPAEQSGTPLFTLLRRDAG